MGWLTAEEALALLGTKQQTLYANVSRGRIQAKPDPTDIRRSLYRSEDIERLAKRSVGRRKTNDVAAEAIHWGAPVLETSISTIIEGRLSYRGQDAAILSQHASLEEIAALLWREQHIDWQQPSSERCESLPKTISTLERAFIAIAQRAALDMPSTGRTLKVLKHEANDVMQTLIAAVLNDAPEGCSRTLHERIAEHWDCPHAADTIRRALVLLADHELNASTFATRVAASTGAPLSAALLAGLATLTGPLHGRAYIAISQLVAQTRVSGAEAAISALLQQGLPVPAFGHPLYPQGDIRALTLLAELDISAPYVALFETGERITGEKPNIDFALSAIAGDNALPADAPLLLFMLARAIGWMAHALEQIETGSLIRPRAHFFLQ